MSNGKGIALIEAAIRNAHATKTGLGYNEIDLKNLARYTIGNWKYVEAEIDSLRAQLKQAREQQDKMRDLLNAILNVNQEFRDTMPENWEGDPLQDACDEARAYLNAALTTNSEAAGDEMVQATTADVQPVCDHPGSEQDHSAPRLIADRPPDGSGGLNQPSGDEQREVI